MSNLSPTLLLGGIQTFLEKHSIFFPFVTDSKLQPFIAGHNAVSAYSPDSSYTMEIFNDLCKQLVDKFDSHIRTQLLSQAPPCPTTPFWNEARCVGGYEGRDLLLRNLDYTRFFSAPQLVDTFVLDRWPIRHDEDRWIVARLSRVAGNGRTIICPHYRHARYETRFWIRPHAIWGRTQVKDFVKIGWSEGRFSIAYQFGYEIDRDEVRQDSFTRFCDLTPDKAEVS